MPVAPAKRRLSWASIDWTKPLPPGFLLPEELYRFETVPGLIWAQRVRLNHLATCFRFEVMLHLKRYVIRYLERHLRRLARRHPDQDLPRFLRDERRHRKALGRVLRKIRPAGHRRLLPWTRTDGALVRFVPATTFFALTSLSEEMARAMPAAIDEHPDECFDPLLDVMRLLAREERRHIAIDDAVLLAAAASRPASLVKAQVLFTIPLLGYLDRRVRRAWTQAIDRFADEEGLTREQRRALRDRKPSCADVAGIRAFLARKRCRRVPGHATLRRVLQAQLG